MDARRQPDARSRRRKALIALVAAAVVGALVWLLSQAASEAGAGAAARADGAAGVRSANEARPATDGEARAAAEPARTALQASPAEGTESPPADPWLSELRGRVVDSAHAPIAGARVSIRRGEARDFTVLDLEISRATELVAEAASDAQGEFRFELERGAPVDVHVEAHGYCPEIAAERHAGEFVEVVLSAGYLAFGRVTRERDGAAIAGARVRVFRLGGPSTLARSTETGPDGRYELRFTFREKAMLEVVPRVEQSSDWIDLTLGAGDTVEKDVVLPDGIVVTGKVSEVGTARPIAGATVGEGWTYRKTAETDAFGEYRLAGFGNQGVGELFAKARGYGHAQRDNLPGAVDGVMRVDFELARARSAFGRVVGADGAPIEGVLAAAVASEFGAGGQRTDWRSDRTDAAGRFLIEDLTPDLRHALLLSKRGLASRVYDFPASELGEPELDLGTFVLGAPALLAGVVAYEGGAAIADAEVVLKGWNSDRFRLLGEHEDRSGRIGDWYVDTRITSTDAAGRFSFGDVAAGSYSLHARALGAESASSAVEVAESAIRDDLKIEFPAAGVLRGRVVDPDGRGIAGVYLGAYVVALREATAEPVRPYSVRTEDGGEFEFRGLRAGAYRIEAFPWAADASDPDAPWLQTTVDRVETDSGEIEIELTRGVTIRGTLSDASGAALFGYTIVAVGPDGPEYSTTTDASGAFALGVPSGTRWDIEVRGAPGSDAWSNVLLTEPAVAAGTRGLSLAVPR